MTHRYIKSEDTLTRRYVKRARAARETDTQRRIVDATIALHDAVGGPATTVTAIAARAGVSRLTVYRHFPDERTLLAACTGTYLEEHPPPDFTAWSEVASPELRLRHALTQLYAFYRQNRGLLARAEQELPTNPILRDVLSGYVDSTTAMRDVLAVGWTQRDPDLVRASIGHAIAFATWQSLAIDQGLGDARAARLVENFVTMAADASRDQSTS